MVIEANFSVSSGSSPYTSGSIANPIDLTTSDEEDNEITLMADKAQIKKRLIDKMKLSMTRKTANSRAATAGLGLTNVQDRSQSRKTRTDNGGPINATVPPLSGRSRSTAYRLRTLISASPLIDSSTSRPTAWKRSSPHNAWREETQSQRKKRKSSQGGITKLSERGGYVGASNGKVKVEGAEWPKKLENTVRGIMQTVGCNLCGGYCHCACAGVPWGQNVMDMEWTCPDCVELLRLGEDIEPVPPRRKDKEKKRIVSEPGDDDLFVMEGIIGTKEIPSTEPGKKAYKYLVKWYDWPIEESTWEEGTSIPHLPTALVDFESEALEADIDTNQKVVLLPVAQTVWDEHGEEKKGSA
ncbi:hypothetical protein CI109_100309 [Kwoniella shandongensis]|uniref:Uncharacterized protein n=1 Tax=Kwoniella shandongensis TaxID=1734106 RepID=A0A5M6C461_9TREE|nr:uncharacterized protein CI109_001846 [Kwoniella shandongensis]KAA5529906.1 hypothetical protein CI109_001846 [Kwoniella shandongensis]